MNCSSGKNASDGDIFWLKIRQEKQQIFFTIGLVTVGKPFLKMAEVSVANDKYLSKLLESKMFTSLISYSLLDQMPFLAVFSGENRNSKKHEITADEIAVLSKGVKISESLVAFIASIDKNGVIYPEVVGRIKTAKIKPIKSYLHADVKYSEINWQLKNIKKQFVFPT